MARTPALLANGSRISDYLSLGILAKWVPQAHVRAVLGRTGLASKRQRDLPADLVVYYVIALAIFMQVSYGEVLRCVLEGFQWLAGPGSRIRIAGHSGISQARSRLGVEPFELLYRELVGPVAVAGSRGAWYRHLRLVTLDGSTLDIPDEAANREVFGLPGASRGESAYPQLRFVALLENGTHILFAARPGSFRTGEITLAKAVISALQPGMLCLADRGFLGYALWSQAMETGAHLLWRAKSHLRLEVLERYTDGSYRSAIYASERDWRHRHAPLPVRVIEYQLKGETEAEDFYRLVTTLQPEIAPADELAALYAERWEIEGAFDELKTHLRGSRVVLRSKTPQLVLQEFYGLLLAHFAVRSLIHEAALLAREDPDRLSFLHAVRVLRRKLPAKAAISP